MTSLVKYVGLSGFHVISISLGETCDDHAYFLSNGTFTRSNCLEETLRGILRFRP